MVPSWCALVIRSSSKKACWVNLTASIAALWSVTSFGYFSRILAAVKGLGLLVVAVVGGGGNGALEDMAELSQEVLAGRQVVWLAGWLSFYSWLKKAWPAEWITAWPAAGVGSWPMGLSLSECHSISRMLRLLLGVRNRSWRLATHCRSCLLAAVMCLCCVEFTWNGWCFGRYCQCNWA